MSLITLITFVLIGIIGLIVLLIVALKPRWFWPMLCIVTVGTGGLVIQKISYVDEYLALCVFLGGILAISIGGVHFQKNKENKWDQFHKLVFIIMIIYLFVQCLDSFMYNFTGLESFKKIRWLALYGLLGLLSCIFSLRGFPFPPVRKMSLIIAATALGYFLPYLTIGWFSENVLKESKLGIFSPNWAGTTYSFFPLVVIIPALIFLIKDKSRLYRRIGWITLLIVTFTSFYYVSRISWLVLFGFLITAFPLLGLRKVIQYSIIFLLLLIIFTEFIWPKWFTLEVFREDLLNIPKVIWDPSATQDMGRFIDIKITFPIISSNWQTFFFGHGFQASGPLIGPNLAKLWTKYGRPDIAAAEEDYQSASAFTVLVVEGGFIGLSLLILNFLFVARKLLFKKEVYGRGILLFSLSVTFLWLFTGTLLDIVLFYLIIVPSGLLIKLTTSQNQNNI